MLKERIIAYHSWDKLTSTEKFQIFTEVEKVIAKRHILWRRYSRGIDFETPSIQYSDVDDTKQAILAEDNTKHIQILLEKFIVDIAAGYLSGTVEYDVDATDEIQARVNKMIFDKDPITPNEALELKYIVNTITKNNCDTTELTKLFTDALLYGSCYERVLDKNKDGYQYYALDALNTVAVWTDDVKPKLMAVVQAYRKKEQPNATDRFLYRVYLPKKIEIYSRENKMKLEEAKLTMDEEQTHEWKEVPVIVHETQFSILDKCQSIIIAYETLLNNIRNTYKYNAEDCKMKIAGYRPQNPITIPNPDYDPEDPVKSQNAPQIPNPARKLEDDIVLSSRTFYVQEGGDADWLIKKVDAKDATTMLKFYIDTIFQLAGIPNTTDLAFNSADLNASAIDRKFYIMNIVTANLREGMEVLIRSRFRMFLDRINLKNNKSYDANNISILIKTNLPSMLDETIDQMLRLDGILSEETILEKLGYDYQTEHSRKEKELNEQLARFGDTDNEDGEETETSNTSDSKGTGTSSIDDVRTNRKLQSKNPGNIQTNIERENAKTVQPSKGPSSPIGHETRGK